MRRPWAVLLAFTIGFVWAVVLIFYAIAADPIPQTTRIITTTHTESRSLAATPAVTASEPEAAEVASVEVATREEQEALYLGNTNTHKFHKKGCFSLRTCVNCTAKFATREEAIAAGFRPCGNCRP